MLDDATRVGLKQKAVESAIEWTKQLITLATGTVVLSGTFIKDIFSKCICGVAWMIICWIAMTVCTVAGICHLGALCATLASSTKEGDLDIYKGGRVVALVEWCAFGIGIISFTVFLVINIVN